MYLVIGAKALFEGAVVCGLPLNIILISNTLWLTCCDVTINDERDLRIAASRCVMIPCGNLSELMSVDDIQTSVG